MTILTPAFTTDQTYPFWVLRKELDAISGVGILNPGDFAVSAGAGMQVSVAAGMANIRQTVNVEGSTFYNGLYEVGNDGASNPFNTILAPSVNPRVDGVILRVYDVTEQGLGGASKAQIEWLPGSETTGATLDNRSGATPLPANSLLLADVLQTVGEVTVGTIRDRRPYAYLGAAPPLIRTFDSVAPIVVGTPLINSASPTVLSSAQAAFAANIPRRITASKIRWSYFQGAQAAVAGGYVMAIYDASMRLIANTGTVAWAGGNNSVQVRAETIPTTTFEPGLYYFMFGFAAGQTASAVIYTTCVGESPNNVLPSSVANTLLYSASGGITPPTTLLGFADASLGAANTPMTAYFTLATA